MVQFSTLAFLFHSQLKQVSFTSAILQYVRVLFQGSRFWRQRHQWLCMVSKIFVPSHLFGARSDRFGNQALRFWKSNFESGSWCRCSCASPTASSGWSSSVSFAKSGNCKQPSTHSIPRSLFKHKQTLNHCLILKVFYRIVSFSFVIYLKFMFSVFLCCILCLQDGWNDNLPVNTKQLKQKNAQNSWRDQKGMYLVDQNHQKARVVQLKLNAEYKIER